MNIVRFLGTRKFRWKMLPFIKYVFLFFGRSWNDFYRWMLNLQERNTTLDMILQSPKSPSEGGNKFGLLAWGMGEYYLEFMKAHGLQPDHVVLDYGCGYGRAAIPLVRYLEPGKYIGTELCDKRVALAEEWVAREGLDDKSPKFIISTDNSMPYLQDQSVDVMWTYSVFTHMPEKEVHQVLDALKRVLKPNGIVYFNYNTSIEGEVGTAPTVKDFYWENDVIEAVAQSHGFNTERASDWEDTIDPKLKKESIMLMLTHGTDN